MLQLEKNYSRIMRRVSSALQRSGRKDGSCELIAASKYTGTAQMEQLARLGCRIFGESRVQDAEEKKAALFERLPDIQWRMIGHLQTNKAARAARLFDAVDSVHSAGLAERLARAAGENEKRLFVMVQVNIGEEKTKSGVSAEEVLELVRYCRSFPELHVQGLMAMTPYYDDPERARPLFRKMNILRDHINECLGDSAMSSLSMGMSRDFEIAIEEGATFVRVGSALFDENTDSYEEEKA